MAEKAARPVNITNYTKPPDRPVGNALSDWVDEVTLSPATLIHDLGHLVSLNIVECMNVWIPM